MHLLRCFHLSTLFIIANDVVRLSTIIRIPLIRGMQRTIIDPTFPPLGSDKTRGLPLARYAGRPGQ